MKELNEMDSLERQLRSWTPRRPSAALERRLFRRTTVILRPARIAGWLTTATACLLFAAVVLNPQKATPRSGSPQAAGMLALVLSNQNYAAYLPGSFQRTHNQLERLPKTIGDEFFSLTNLTR